MHVHAIIYLSLLFVPVNQSINQSKTFEKRIIAVTACNGISDSVTTAIQGFDSGPVTARNITRKSVLPNFARHVLSKS